MFQYLLYSILEFPQLWDFFLQILTQLIMTSVKKEDEFTCGQIKQISRVFFEIWISFIGFDYDLTEKINICNETKKNKNKKSSYTKKNCGNYSIFIRVFSSSYFFTWTKWIYLKRENFNWNKRKDCVDVV